MKCNPCSYLSMPYIILSISACLFCEQNDIYEWARDHRVHHKYSETDADPHNAKRGFFFAHIGWLMVRKHPDVIEKGKKLELTDLKADKVVMFQRRWANITYSLFWGTVLFFLNWCNQNFCFSAILTNVQLFFTVYLGVTIEHSWAPLHNKYSPYYLSSMYQTKCWCLQNGQHFSGGCLFKYLTVATNL